MNNRSLLQLPSLKDGDINIDEVTEMEISNERLQSELAHSDGV